MREVLFRGFSKEKKEWVYGELIRTYFPIGRSDLPAIINCEGIWPTCFESIGQFIGRKDKSDKKVYEDDIIRGFYCCAVCFDNEPHEIIGNVVQHDDGEWAVDYGHGSISISALLENYLIEVIGNIYENPELLEDK